MKTSKAKSGSSFSYWLPFLVVMCFFTIPRIIRNEQKESVGKKLAIEIANKACDLKSKGYSEEEYIKQSFLPVLERERNRAIKGKIFESTLVLKMAECGIDMNKFR